MLCSNEKNGAHGWNWSCPRTSQNQNEAIKSFYLFLWNEWCKLFVRTDLTSVTTFVKKNTLHGLILHMQNLSSSLWRFPYLSHVPKLVYKKTAMVWKIYVCLKILLIMYLCKNNTFWRDSPIQKRFKYEWNSKDGLVCKNFGQKWWISVTFSSKPFKLIENCYKYCLQSLFMKRIHIKSMFWLEVDLNLGCMGYVLKNFCFDRDISQCLLCVIKVIKWHEDMYRLQERWFLYL